MGNESDSGHEPHDPDERHVETEWLDSSGDSSEADTRAGNASTADTRAGPSDWITSFRDVEFNWNDPGRVREPPRWSDDEWLLSPDSELHTDIDAQAKGDTTADSLEPGEWWRTFSDEEASFAVDNSPAFPADADDRTRAASGVATATAAVFEDMPTAGQSWRRVAIAAAVAVLFTVAAVGVVALIGRNGETKSSVATTARSKSSITTASSAATTSTIAPATAPSPPSAVPPTPSPFTVHATCDGRDCPVAVREGPSTAAKKAGSLRTGEVVQIDCSTHGESIEDTDTGRRSDVWYRLAYIGGYLSALYLEGPTAPDCR